jgi:transcriptional regulator with XRE-family HTH domain
MATQLGIAQATYSKMESGETGLSIDRCQQIADILETDMASLIDTSKITIQNQTNNDIANGYVENLHVENKETTTKLIESLENHIQTLTDENRHLKGEIEFLRSLVKERYCVSSPQ